MFDINKIEKDGIIKCLFEKEQQKQPDIDFKSYVAGLAECNTLYNKMFSLPIVGEQMQSEFCLSLLEQLVLTGLEDIKTIKELIQDKIDNTESIKSKMTLAKYMKNLEATVENKKKETSADRAITQQNYAD